MALISYIILIALAGELFISVSFEIISTIKKCWIIKKKWIFSFVMKRIEVKPNSELMLEQQLSRCGVSMYATVLWGNFPVVNENTFVIQLSQMTNGGNREHVHYHPMPCVQYGMKGVDYIGYWWETCNHIAIVAEELSVTTKYRFYLHLVDF